MRRHLQVALSIATAGFCFLSLVPSYAVASGSWSSPAQIDSSALEAVSCSSASFCIASDDNGDAVTDTAGNWGTPRSTPITGTDDIASLSCVSSTFCAGLDGAGGVLAYHGSSWNAPVSALSAPTTFGLSISCAPQTTFCVAVSGDSYAYTEDGDTWTSPSTQIDTGNGLTAVSCPSASFCVAVDDAGRALTYDGSGWSKPAVVDEASASDDGLTSVSCPSPADCTAVARNGDEVTETGGKWASPVGIDTGTVLTSVSCASSSFCVAVDAGGQAFIGSGSLWQDSGTVDPNGLVSVSCVSSSFCAAVDSAGYAVTYTGTSGSGGKTFTVTLPIDEDASLPAWGDRGAFFPGSLTLAGTIGGSITDAYSDSGASPPRPSFTTTFPATFVIRPQGGGSIALDLLGASDSLTVSGNPFGISSGGSSESLLRRPVEPVLDTVGRASEHGSTVTVPLGPLQEQITLHGDPVMGALSEGGAELTLQVGIDGIPVIGSSSTVHGPRASPPPNPVGKFTDDPAILIDEIQEATDAVGVDDIAAGTQGDEAWNAFIGPAFKREVRDATGSISSAVIGPAESLWRQLIDGGRSAPRAATPRTSDTKAGTADPRLTAGVRTAGSSITDPALARLARLRRSDLRTLRVGRLRGGAARTAAARLVDIHAGVRTGPLLIARRPPRRGGSVTILAGGLVGPIVQIVVSGPGYTAIRDVVVRHGLAGARIDLPRGRHDRRWYVGIVDDCQLKLRKDRLVGTVRLAAASF